MRVKNAKREQSLNEYVRAGPGNGPGRRGDTASRFYEAAEVGACAAPNPAAEVITPAPRFGEGTCRRQTAVSACLYAGDGVTGKCPDGKKKKNDVTVQSCVKENERMAAEGRYRRDLPPIIIRFSGM